MWYIIAVLTVVAAFIVGIAGYYGFSQARAPGGTNGLKAPDKKPVFLGRKDIYQRLLRLAQSPAPTNLSQGAECYEVSCPPDRAEYVCPVCGEKTLYTNSSGVDLSLEISIYRSQVAGLTNMLDIRMDESSLCKKCGKGANPEITFIIHYSDEDKEIRRNDLTREDLKLLHELLSGTNVHSGFYGEGYPLQKYIPDLERILGVKLTNK